MDNALTIEEAMELLEALHRGGGDLSKEAVRAALRECSRRHPNKGRLSMDAWRLLSDLWNAGIRLDTDGEHLVAEAGAGAMTDQLRELIRSNKEELLAVLTASKPPRACWACKQRRWRQYAPGQYVCECCHPNCSTYTREIHDNFGRTDQ